MRENYLFYEGDLAATLRSQEEKMAGYVEALPKDQLLATPEDLLVEAVAAKVEVDPLKLYEDRMTLEQTETKIDVSSWRSRNPFGDPGPIYVHGLRVTVSIPFTGDPELWKCRPNTFQSVFPQGQVDRPRAGVGALKLVYEIPSDEPPDNLKRRLDSDLDTMRFYVSAQERQVAGFNSTIPTRVSDLISRRRERIKKHDSIADMLGIPLRQNVNAPAMEPIQLQRKVVKPLPSVPAGSYKPEPGISDGNYEYILKVIRHEGKTFETTPKTYVVHDEEELRDIVLAHLNGHLSGGATGETFRRNGKTDIRIEDDKRAAFIAECKVWRGAKELSSAIDQLLSYLTWRDGKAAVVIFNKHTAGFTELLAKVPETFRTHPKFRKDLGQQGSGEWRYLFSSQEDELREVTVHVFIFNLYVAAEAKVEAAPKKKTGVPKS